MTRDGLEGPDGPDGFGAIGAVQALEVAGYRSLRELRLPLGRTNVITGPNGSGKTNLYNAVRLLARAADGAFGATIAREGGMPSVLWAGGEGPRLARRPPPRRVRLAVTTGGFGYELQCGLPQSGPPGGSMFLLDPEVKEESVWLAGDPLAGTRGGRPARRVTLMERAGTSTSVRDAGGGMVRYPLSLLGTESVLSQIRDPHRYPELSAFREVMRRWRFYHHFRTDGESPLRQPQTGVLTPVLAHEGTDLAAALQTIREIGDGEALAGAVDGAFPGGRLEVQADGVRFQVLLHLPGVLRPLAASELSDGTLRYLCLVAALLSPRPAALLALNEPETSLHPDLLVPLAELIARAAGASQLWVTTHSTVLAGAIEHRTGEPALRLRLEGGETRLSG